MNRRPRFGDPFRERIDARTIERLLSGRLDPRDASVEWAHVARIIRRLTAPASPEELAVEGVAVAAAIRALGERGTPQLDHRRPARSRSRARRFGLVAVATVLLMTGMAAADVLPDRAQIAISDTLSVVGIEVPRGTSETVEPSAIDRPASTGSRVAQLATGTDATGVEKGARISRLASGGVSRAGERGHHERGPERGKASNGPPGDHGNGPADPPGRGSSTAPRGGGGSTNAPGAATADEASNGRSSAGRGNADR